MDRERNGWWREERTDRERNGQIERGKDGQREEWTDRERNGWIERGMDG